MSGPSSQFGFAVGTFGSNDWNDAGTALMDDLRNRFRKWSVSHTHINSTRPGALAEARNHAVHQMHDAGIRWVAFIDADDRPRDGFDTAMEQAVGQHTAGMFQPATVDSDADTDVPNLIPPRGRTLLHGNHMVIATLVPVAAVVEVGGFDPSYQKWEDWDLWLRVHAIGNPWRTVPEAVYEITVRAGSRNNVEGPRRLGHTIKTRHLEWLGARGIDPSVHQL